MLVVGRKVGQSIVIGDIIKVTVVEGANGELRLAIDAPKEINIIREEKYEPRSEKSAALHEFAKNHEKYFNHNGSQQDP